MEIVVNHLTRMQPGYICVAGVNLENKEHVRPVLSGARLSKDLLSRNGGPFDIAAIVDPGTTKGAGSKPEVEDCLFDPSKARFVKNLGAEKFWKLLTELAQLKLSIIFGNELKSRGPKSIAVDVGRGKASLGCLGLVAHSDLYLRPRAGKPDQIRIRVSDGEFDLDLGVTDIRLYEDDHVTPNSNVVRGIAKCLVNRRGVVLSVGLTRPFSSSPDFPAVHWLQVNNIHLEDDPTWRLG